MLFRSDWAHQSLPAKNTLTVADAQLVEASFRVKLAMLGGEEPAEPPESVQSPNNAETAKLDPEAEASEITSQDERDTRRGRVATKTVRLRNKDHRTFVSLQPCLVCGRTPADAHHLRFAQPRALGRKVSDEFTVPVCRVHHRELHRQGSEASWWKGIDIDPLPVALRLWQHTRHNSGVEAGSGDAEVEPTIALNDAKPAATATGPDLNGDEQRLTSLNAETGAGR